MKFMSICSLDVAEKGSSVDFIYRSVKNDSHDMKGLPSVRSIVEDCVGVLNGFKFQTRELKYYYTNVKVTVKGNDAILVTYSLHI